MSDITSCVEYVSQSADETSAFGAAFGSVLAAGDLVLAIGGLGAGKTTLVKGIVAGLGSIEPVTSPTFTLVHSYDTIPPVVHVDCWRLESSSEVLQLALWEHLDDGAAVIVEWGERAKGLIANEAFVVRIKNGEQPNWRSIEVTGGQAQLDQMATLAHAVTGLARRGQII